MLNIELNYIVTYRSVTLNFVERNKNHFVLPDPYNNNKILLKNNKHFLQERERRTNNREIEERQITE